MGCFETLGGGGELHDGPHNNRMIAKNSLCHYAVMTSDLYLCQLMGLNFSYLKPWSDLAEVWYKKLFWSANFRYQVRFYF